MATKATLAALGKLESLREGVLARTARKDFAGDPARFKEFSVTLDDLLFDYSKQRIDAAVLGALVELAKACGVEAKRAAMFAGEKINITEKRAVLHTALRNFSGRPVLVDEVAHRLRELLAEKAAELGMTIHALEVMSDHVHLFVEGDPTRLTLTGLAPGRTQIKLTDADGKAETFDAAVGSKGTLTVPLGGTISLQMNTKKPIEGATGRALAEAIKAHGHHAVRYVADKNDVAQVLHDEVEPGDIVIALGAGDINASARKLAAMLEAKR